MIEKNLYKPLALVSGAVWFGFLFLYTVIWVIEGALPPDLFQRFLVYIFSVSLTFIAGPFVFLFLNIKTILRWLAVLILAIITLLLHSLIGSFIAMLTLPVQVVEQTSFFKIFSTAMIYDSPIVSSAFISFIAIHYGHQLNKQQRLSLQTENAARNAQLEALRHQLNPHFFFNTLNSISALVTEGDTENAEKTILLLSEFLRFSLDSDPVALISFNDELACVDKYLQIEQVRYEDRLMVKTNIDEAARDWRVPPFLLQPILENVIKHAVSKVSRQICVNISCMVMDDVLIIHVEDDGPGLSAPVDQSSGMGLSNLRTRLNLIYGPKVMMDIDQRVPMGVRIAIKIEKGSLTNA